MIMLRVELVYVQCLCALTPTLVSSDLRDGEVSGKFGE